MKQIFVKMPAGNTLTFTMKKSTNVGQLKNFIFKRTGLPSTWQRFVYSGKPFDKNNLNLIDDINIRKEATIHLLLRFHGVGCNCERCLYSSALLRNGKRL